MATELARAVCEALWKKAGRLPPDRVTVGAIILDPDGKKVQITGGQYWGLRGVSNFWNWREILPDGSLSEEEKHGYGWW